MSLPDHRLSSHAVLTHQVFDSKFLDGAVWRLDLDTPPDRPTLAGVDDFARSNDVRLIVARVPLEWCDSFEESGFRNIEHLLTLERELDPTEQAGLPPRLRLAGQEDGAATAAIAGTAFTTDRYHSDPDISNTAADALKAAWVQNNVEGRADTTFLAIEDGRISGFNSCLRRGDTAVIDLIAIRRDERGKGLGGLLVDAAIAHYAGKSRVLQVGTQVANSASRVLYEKRGFTLAREQVTFHLHPLQFPERSS